MIIFYIASVVISAALIFNMMIGDIKNGYTYSRQEILLELVLCLTPVIQQMFIVISLSEMARPFMKPFLRGMAVAALIIAMLAALFVLSDMKYDFHTHGCSTHHDRP